MIGPRVLIVEDEVIVAEDLRRHLEASGYEVIGHAMDGQEAVHLARNLHPDVILMDVLLRGRANGIETAKTIQRSVDTTIIYVSGQSDERLVKEAVAAGAFGYVVKPFQMRQITSSISIALHRRSEARAVEERAHLMPSASLLASHVSHGHGDPSATIEGLSLTAREREIIHGLVSHRRLARVADVLGISVHTARNHLKSVFRKLNLHSQDELLDLLEDNEPFQPS
jgi:DNA-binding NarL/FixJ family response regulator